MVRGHQFPVCSPPLSMSRAPQTHWEHLLPQPLLGQRVCAGHYLPLTAALGSGCQHPHFTDQEAEAQTDALP